MLAYLYHANGLLSFALFVVVVAFVATVLIWLAGYLSAPAFVAKFIVAFAVLYILLELFSSGGIW